jgi:uncharacterized protein YkwD
MMAALLFIGIMSHAQTPQYDQLNRERLKHLRMPIKRDSVLEQQAAEWLRIMQVKYHGRLVHGPIRLLARYEVLTTSDDPVEAWMNSKSHRKAIFSRRVRRIGIAKVNGVYCARLR